MKPRRFTKYPISKAFISVEDLCKVMKDRWWIIEYECLSFFDRGSPQCNANREIAAHLSDDREVRFIAQIFIPVRHYEDGREVEIPENGDE